MEIDTAPVEDINNDHVISPDGRWIFVSSKMAISTGCPSPAAPRAGFRTTGRRPMRSGITCTAFRRMGRGSPMSGFELRAGRPMARIWTTFAAGGDDCLHAEWGDAADGPDLRRRATRWWFNGEPP
ncbi:MAG: hypothetical protein R3D59_09110 [Paracoccaceae bacterium]